MSKLGDLSIYVLITSAKLPISIRQMSHLEQIVKVSGQNVHRRVGVLVAIATVVDFVFGTQHKQALFFVNCVLSRSIRTGQSGFDYGPDRYFFQAFFQLVRRVHANTSRVELPIVSDKLLIFISEVGHIARPEIVGGLFYLS